MTYPFFWVLLKRGTENGTENGTEKRNGKTERKDGTEKRNLETNPKYNAFEKIKFYTVFISRYKCINK